MGPKAHVTSNIVCYKRLKLRSEIKNKGVEMAKLKMLVIGVAIVLMISLILPATISAEGKAKPIVTDVLVLESDSGDVMTVDTKEGIVTFKSATGEVEIYKIDDEDADLSEVESRRTGSKSRHYFTQYMSQYPNGYWKSGSIYIEEDQQTTISVIWTSSSSDVSVGTMAAVSFPPPDIPVCTGGSETQTWTCTSGSGYFKFYVKNLNSGTSTTIIYPSWWTDPV